MAVLWAALAVLGLGAYLYYLFWQRDIPRLVRSLRWVIGGGALALAAILGLGGRFGIASLLAVIGTSVLARGRLGPIDFNTYGPSPGRTSKVRSRFFRMELDHEQGAVFGTVIAGDFAGRDLLDLSEEDVRHLFTEIAHDPDSVTLLETWLDANRSGWREHFDQQTGNSGQQQNTSNNTGPMGEEEALEILGLTKGASEDDIRAARNRLLKAVHPDHGGSNFLASRINAAADYLLKARK